MKSYSILAVIAITIAAGACRKDYNPYGNNKGNPPVRKVRFELFTDKDFAGNQGNIQFRLHMENADRAILDSNLAIMKIEDIPDSAHRIIIEKLVPGNDTSTLTVGFVYYIENVGISWHLESFPAGDTLKVVRYPFE